VTIHPDDRDAWAEEARITARRAARAAKPRKTAPERAIQIAIKQLLILRGIVALHIPNEGKRSAVAGRMLRAEGMIAGAPDLLLLADNGRTGWLEVKAANGRLSDAQRAFHALLTRKGHRVAVVRSVDDAEAALRDWGWIR
jgi:hypothetical protein